MKPCTPCIHCSEPVDPGEAAAQHDIHADCQLRLVAGGLNHQRGTCSCYGGSDPPDPPDLTRYEAAKAAANYFRWQSGRA